MRNKKFMSRLFSAVLAGAMVLSMIPAAFAAGSEDVAPQHFCGVDHSNHTHVAEYTSNNNGTHNWKCTFECDGWHGFMGWAGTYECDASASNLDCTYVNGYCSACGYEHDHWANSSDFTWSDNEDGTHSATCTCGKTVVDHAAHVYTDGVCLACGAEEPAEPECDHWAHIATATYESDGKGRHDVRCSECGEVFNNAACNCEDGACICGYVKPAALACDHVGKDYTYTDNKNGTHKVTCECGKVVTEEAQCVYVDGKCGACGAEEPACDHMGNHWDYVDNKDGTHNVVCKDCETAVSTLKHTYTDGKCICGAVEKTCDHVGTEYTYTDNGNGTHKVTCACGEVVNESAACVWESGKCVCGSEEPACDHMGNNWSYVNNENGTHNVVCKDCEEVVSENVAHYFIDGKCICGAVEETCDHMGNHWSYVNKGETHDVVCADCGETVTADMAHYFVDGKCICGAEKAEDAELKTVAINFYSEDEEKQIAEVEVEVAADATYINTSILTAPKGYEIAIVGDLPIRDGYVYVVVRKAESTCDHMANDWSYVNNEDGTHNVVCNACEEVVSENVAHYFIDGKCICGAVEKTCDHMGNHWKYVANEDGKTHKVICADCGETVSENADCNWESGKCVCGSEKPAEKPVQPEEPTTPDEPTKPTTPSKNNGVSILGGLLESAGLASFFRILIKALFHI